MKSYEQYNEEMKLRSRNFCVINVLYINISDYRIMTYFLLKKKNKILIEFKSIFLLLLCFIVLLLLCEFHKI